MNRELKAENRKMIDLNHRDDKYARPLADVRRGRQPGILSARAVEPVGAGVDPAGRRRRIV